MKWYLVYIMKKGFYNVSQFLLDFLCPTSWLSRQSNGRSNPEVVGSIPTEVKRSFSLPRVVPWFPLLGVSHSTLIYTSELILCSTICVHSATRHNIHMYPYLISFRRGSPP